MPTFPRTFKPRDVGKFTYPAPLMSFGHSGKGQFRETAQRGRMWEEWWSALDVSQQTVSDFLALCDRYWQSGQIFDIDYYFWQTRPFGAGGGTPLVNGASQTGSNLVIDGAPFTTTAWLKAGDIIKVAGRNIVFDVTADVNTDGAGNATIPIFPSLLVGQSPANNAAVTISGVLFRAAIVELPSAETISPAKHLLGFRIAFREMP
jgi:hypothetical protein